MKPPMPFWWGGPPGPRPTPRSAGSQWAVSESQVVAPVATAGFPFRSLPKRAHLPCCLASLFLLAAGVHAQPTNVSVSPASGSSAGGAAQSFTATYADSLGAGYITDMYFLVNTNASSAASACYVQWFGYGNALYLVNDGGTAWLGPLTLGSGATLQNSQCTLYGTGSSVNVAGTPATMTLNLSFTAAFAGTKGTYMSAVDSQGYYNAFQQMGSWTITATGYPDLTIAKSHSGNFTQGQAGAYTITATNSGSGVTSGTVTVTDSLPSGLTASALSGSGWTCTVSTVTCTRSDA